MSSKIGVNQSGAACRRARALAEAINDAMQRDQWTLADRLATTAERLANEHGRLREQIARLRLAQGDAQSALDCIEAGPLTSSQRLLRAACLVQLGRRPEAHLDLREWARRASAPLQARILLGLLDWHADDADAAFDAMQHNIRQVEDPHTLAAMMLMSAAMGRHERAARWADRLRNACACSDDAPLFEIMLRSLGLESNIHMEEGAPSPQQVETLAMELLAHEVVIPALVEAQRNAETLKTARLLAAAIECVLIDLDDRAAGYAALIELSLMRDDQAAALRWARQGQNDCPMSVTLTRAVQQLASADADRHECEEVLEQAA